MINLDAAYVLSSFVCSAQGCDLTVVWHSLFGHPKIVSNETFEFLKSFSTPKTLRSCLGNELTAEETESMEGLIKDLILVLEGFDDRALLEERMRVQEADINSGALITYLELIMSEVCNFNCDYCIHFKNLETSDRVQDSKKFMHYSTAKKAVDGYIEILRKHGKNIAEINFGGGEPLLAWRVIKRVLEYCCAQYNSEFEFRFSINTNASLITRNIAEILKKYRVAISSSLDGLYDGNDSVRRTRFGGGTFSTIICGFNVLEQAEYPLSGIAVTVNEKNFYQLDESIIDWAAARGMKDVRIDIDVIGMVGVPVNDIVSKLMCIRHYAANLGIDVFGFWSRAAENLNESTLDGRTAFCGAVRGNSLCINPSGNIYACGYSSVKIGSLQNIKLLCAPNTAYNSFVIPHLTGATEMCRGCMIEGQCGGGCHITQEFEKKSQSEKIARMCELYKLMFVEIILEQVRKLVI